MSDNAGRSRETVRVRTTPGQQMPQNEPDEVAVSLRLVRIAAFILLISQPIRLLSQINLKWHYPPNIVFLYHFCNSGVTVLFLASTWTQWFRRWWQAASFALCFSIVISASVTSILSASRTEALFASLLLLVFGTALLVPWAPRWQAALNITAILDMAVTDTLVATKDPLLSLHWFALLVAVALAQSASWFMRRSREQRLDIRRLTESEERLQREVVQRELAQQQLNESLRELTQIQSDLIDAREQAMAALQAKSEFLSSISHEIRTPMNVILGMADVLSETPLNRDQRRYLETMRANGRLLLGLINSVLDLALIESGHLVLEQIGFDLVELAERAAETMAISAHGKGLELVVRIIPDVPTKLIGDPLRLHQILLNLLSNALKFTHRGEVLLTITRKSDVENGKCMLHFSIADTGIGIPSNKQEAIFSHFTQVDSSTTREYGGSGLGLAIVKRLVELMKGTLWVESEVGKGSVFHFRITLAVEQRPDHLGEDRGLGGVRILIADGTATNRLAMGEFLSYRGGDVDAAGSVDEVMEKLASAASSGRPYQCLLVDFQMPEAATILCSQARSEGGGAPLWDNSVPVIPMLTTAELNAKLARLRAAGFRNWLLKPVKRADLMSAIADLLGIVQLRSLPVDQVAARQEVTVTKPLHILLAEDSTDNQVLIQAYLKNTGHRLDFAENGKVALDKFMASRYDVVLMDHQMPVLDGYAAVRAIRRWERQHDRPRTPIIALTASAFAEDVRAGLEAGCDAHISKPVRKDILLQALRAAGDFNLKGEVSSASASPTLSPTLEEAPVVEVAMELKEITPGFLANKRADVAVLRAALKERDYERLQRLGHMLKGEGGSYGFDAITQLGAGVEQAASQKDKAALENLIATLTRYLDTVSVVFR
jgi:signal transduction histidine kinase/DNA-binding response OmpR family regulator